MLFFAFGLDKPSLNVENDFEIVVSWQQYTRLWLCQSTLKPLKPQNVFFFFVKTQKFPLMGNFEWLWSSSVVFVVQQELFGGSEGDMEKTIEAWVSFLCVVHGAPRAVPCISCTLLWLMCPSCCSCTGAGWCLSAVCGREKGKGYGGILTFCFQLFFLKFILKVVKSRERRKQMRKQKLQAPLLAQYTVYMFNSGLYDCCTQM